MRILRWGEQSQEGQWGCGVPWKQGYGSRGIGADEGQICGISAGNVRMEQAVGYVSGIFFVVDDL